LDAFSEYGLYEGSAYGLAESVLPVDKNVHMSGPTEEENKGPNPYGHQESHSYNHESSNPTISSKNPQISNSVSPSANPYADPSYNPYSEKASNPYSEPSSKPYVESLYNPYEPQPFVPNSFTGMNSTESAEKKFSFEHDERFEMLKKMASQEQIEYQPKPFENFISPPSPLPNLDDIGSEKMSDIPNFPNLPKPAQGSGHEPFNPAGGYQPTALTHIIEPTNKKPVELMKPVVKKPVTKAEYFKGITESTKLIEMGINELRFSNTVVALKYFKDVLAKLERIS